MSNRPRKAPCSIALLAHAGMDIKSLQYLMGHSDAGVTMNVYTHATYDHAEATMLTPNLHHLAERLRELIHHYKIYQSQKVLKSI